MLARPYSDQMGNASGEPARFSSPALEADIIPHRHAFPTGPVTINYVYDPLNRLIGLNGGASAFTYAYNGLGNLSQSNGTQPDYFLGDVLGSTRQLADGSGQIGLTQGFEPCGSLAYADGRQSSIFGYAGQQTDASGLQYLRARYYLPSEGRFINRDMFAGDVELP